MPREDVRERDGNNVVRVGWAAEGGPDVQVATLNMEFYRPGEDNTNAGWFINLDRRGINSLIRALRRARDVTFGRDE